MPNQHHGHSHRINIYKAKQMYIDNEIKSDMAIVTENGIITDTLSFEELKTFSSNEDARIIDFGTHSLMLPSLFNTHAHLPMIMLKGVGEDIGLHEWLHKKIFPIESKILSAHETIQSDFFRLGMQLALIQLIKNGTSAVNDMYFKPELSLDILIRSGAKAVVGIACIGDIDSPSVSSLEERILSLKAKLYNNKNIKISLAPHSTSTTSEETYKYILSLAKEHKLLIHTHVAEAYEDEAKIFEKFGKTSIQLLKEIGILDNPHHTILAHAVHLTDKDIEIINDSKLAFVSHQPKANLKLYNGIARINKLKHSNVTIGTDGSASNNSLNILSELNFAGLLHKNTEDVENAPKMHELLNMATINSANALGFNSGSLEKGKDADFMIIHTQNFAMIPNNNALANVIYAEPARFITHLFVDGKAIMQHNTINTIDEQQVLKNAQELTQIINEL